MMNGQPIVKAGCDFERNRFAMVKRIIRHGQHEHLQKTIFDQSGKHNHKVWGVRHVILYNSILRTRCRCCKTLKGISKIQVLWKQSRGFKMPSSVHKRKTDKKIPQRSLMAFALLFRGSFQTILWATMFQYLVVVLCITLKTRSNT